MPGVMMMLFRSALSLLIAVMSFPHRSAQAGVFFCASSKLAKHAPLRVATVSWSAALITLSSCAQRRFAGSSFLFLSIFCHPINSLDLHVVSFKVFSQPCECAVELL